MGSPKDICQPMLLLRYIFISNCISGSCRVRLASTATRIDLNKKDRWAVLPACGGKTTIPKGTVGSQPKADPPEAENLYPLRQFSSLRREAWHRDCRVSTKKNIDPDKVKFS